MRLVYRDVCKHEYSVLERDIQKREEEIRSHFRVEQEQRVYQQDLEEKIIRLKGQL